ncbi:hypothetical protein [Actinobaculum suis]|uniref:hypothetical protein n=1 Tax=Actinobaculum suis TaxID=1657 RepID=UPI0018CD69DA|nr:hypothetical protein [Actinobaculum suis]
MESVNFQKLVRLTIVNVCAISLSITFGGVANAAPLREATPSSQHNSHSILPMTPAPVLSEDQLLATFKAIEEIPDSVLQAGDAAAQSWLKARLGDDFHSQPGSVTTFGVVGCVSAIGLAIVTNLPIFKITKIRTALKAAGGATKFVKTFKRVYDAQRKAKVSFKTAVSRAVKRAAKKAGPEAQQTLIELFNLGNVYSACFE